MAEAKTAVAHKPIWTDLATSDAEGAREFYSKVFGWKVEVNPDPQYGGYALAKIGGKDVAGIGPKQMDEAPTAWTVYIGTADAADTAKKAEAAGAKIIVPTWKSATRATWPSSGPERRTSACGRPARCRAPQSSGSNAMGWVSSTRVVSRSRAVLQEAVRLGREEDRSGRREPRVHGDSS
jgi:predicted enzyme related to lactoylglutathione lyase